MWKPRYRVPRAVLARGARIEAEEHPGFSQRSTRKIARQHIQKYGPGMYTEATEKYHDRFIAIQNKRLGIRPIQRQRMPTRQSPFP